MMNKASRVPKIAPCWMAALLLGVLLAIALGRGQQGGSGFHYAY